MLQWTLTYSLQNEAVFREAGGADTQVYAN